MKGSLSDIETGVEELIKRLSDYYDQHGAQPFKNISMAVLIPFKYVTKVIGAGGCLIKEIQSRTGAAIRVCSNKDDSFKSEIVVTVDGSNEQKQRGVNAILEKVELFRNGGPVSHF